MEQSVREYELTNHLGNVLSTITDKGVITSAQDYYPFGLTLASRSFTEGGSAYRYSFNGKEDDKSLKSQDYGARMYRKDLGRFLSVDPIGARFPHLTPYQFANNNPLASIDLDGLESKLKTKKTYDGGSLNEVEVVSSRIPAPDITVRYSVKQEVFQEYVSKKEYDANIKSNPTGYHSHLYKNSEQGVEITLYYKDQTIAVTTYQVIDNKTQGIIGQGVYLSADLDKDDDGASATKDRTKLSQTSLYYKDCKKCAKQYLNASTDPFIAAPSDFMEKYGLKQGDHAIIKYNGKEANAVIGDGSGKAPRSKIGEASVKVLVLLGLKTDIETNTVLQIFFPNSGKGNGNNPYPLNTATFETHLLNFQRAKYQIDNGTAVDTDKDRP